jgi:hypothetical protein
LELDCLHSLGGVAGMKLTQSTLFGAPWLCLAATALLIQGCAPKPPAWNGIYAIDAGGGARTCVAPTTSVPDGQTVQAQVQVSDEGGWCGETLSHNGAAYDAYLLVTAPSHGRVFAHHVANNTRIDYTPDRGYVGTDRFAIRLIPGNATFEAAVTVTQ